MGNRLTKDPATWFLQCRYCNPKDQENQPYSPRRHETELLAKAKRLCKNHHTNHFLDYVTAELDTLDHSILTPITMIEILTQIHTSLPCSCQDTSIQEIEQLTKSNQYVTIPAAYAIPTTPPKIAKRPGRTLLERLQNGKNGQQK